MYTLKTQMPGQHNNHVEIVHILVQLYSFWIFSLLIFSLQLHFWQMLGPKMKVIQKRLLDVTMVLALNSDVLSPGQDVVI